MNILLHNPFHRLVPMLIGRLSVSLLWGLLRREEVIPTSFGSSWMLEQMLIFLMMYVLYFSLYFAGLYATYRRILIKLSVVLLYNFSHYDGELFGNAFRLLCTVDYTNRKLNLVPSKVVLPSIKTIHII